MKKNLDSSDMFKTLFTTERFVRTKRKKPIEQVKDKYDIHTALQGTGKDKQMVVMFEPKDGQYLTGKMDEIKEHQRLEFEEFAKNKQVSKSQSKMTYFLEITDKQLIEESVDIFTDKYELAKKSFNSIVPGPGFQILNKIIQENEERYQEMIEIKNDQGKTVSFEEFAEVLNDNHVKQ